MDTVQTLASLIENSQTLAYLIIFLVTIVEGEIVALSTGVLILLGALNFWIAFIAIFCGSIIKTFLGYFIGKFLNEKFNHSKFFQYIERKVLTMMPHFEEKPFWSIFASKFLMVNHVVIIFAGYKKINFNKFLKAELLSTPIWAVSLLALGYFFSYTALQINKGITEFFLIILLFVIGFFLIEKVVSLLFDVFQNIFHNHEHNK